MYIGGQRKNELKQHHLEQIPSLDTNFQYSILKQVRDGSLSIGEMHTKCKEHKAMVAKTIFLK